MCVCVRVCSNFAGYGLTRGTYSCLTCSRVSQTDAGLPCLAVIHRSLSECVCVCVSLYSWAQQDCQVDLVGAESCQRLIGTHKPL